MGTPEGQKEKPTVVERAWSEYLAWTRGASPGQYEETELRAWARYQRAVLAEADKAVGEGVPKELIEPVLPPEEVQPPSPKKPWGWPGMPR